jgi:hypothetical protein
MNYIERSRRVVVNNSRLVCLVILLALDLISSGCIGDLSCGEEVLAEQVSPDRVYTAVLMVDNCGATSSFGTHVNIRKSQEQFKKEPSGLILDGKVFRVMYKFPVQMEWLSNKKLKISCDGCIRSRLIVKDDKWGMTDDNHWGDVEIEYEFIDSKR